MDIQGSEVLVLKGASQLLKANKHIKLFTELWPKGLKQAGSSAAEYFSLLKQHAFSLYEIDSQNKKLNKASQNRLIAKYPEDRSFNADLFCTKS